MSASLRITLGAIIVSFLIIPSKAVTSQIKAPEKTPKTYDEAFKQGNLPPAPDVHYAGEVIITSRRVANIEQAGTTTTIDRKNIEAHGDRSLADVLERIPGIQVYTHTKGHQRIKLRGFDQDKVVILIDGMPINDVYSTDVDLSAIPLVNVSKIIVNKGVSSALYGSDGAMGTINVITRKPPGSFAHIFSEYGSHNTVYNTLVLGSRLGDFYFMGTGSMLHFKGFSTSKRLDATTRRRWFDRIIRYKMYPVDDSFANGGPYYTFDDVLTPAKNQYIHDDNLWNHQNMRKYQLSAKVGYALGASLDAGISAEYYYATGETNTYQVNSYNQYRGDRWKPRYPYFSDEKDQVKKFALRNRSFVWPNSHRLNIQNIGSSKSNT